MTSFRPRPRRGISLIEVIVVMSGVAVVLGLCAVTMQLLFRLNADGQARLSASATFARLASQFRSDAHGCDEAVLLPAAKAGTKEAEPKSAASLRLTRGPQVVITYEAREGRVARVETVGGTTKAHESYRVGKGNVVAFERREEGERRFLALVLSRAAGKNEIEPPRPLEVLALPGKDRLATATTKGGRPK
jgi:type II secretory pathway pseudopilin PulG